MPNMEPKSILHASYSYRKFVVLISGLFMVYNLLILPIAREPWPTGSPYLPSFLSFIALLELTTSIVMFKQFCAGRKWFIGLSAAAFMYSAVLKFIFIAASPGRFAASGLISIGSHGASWLWVLWHAGFSLVILTAVLVDRADSDPAEGSAGAPAGWLTVALPLFSAAFAAGCGTAVALLDDRLPRLYRDQAHHPMIGPGIAIAASMLCVVTLASLYRSRRLKNMTSVWVFAAVLSSFSDVLLTAASGKRNTVGWYAGRVNLLLNSLLVCLGLLYEFSWSSFRRTQQARLMNLYMDYASVGMVQLDLSGETQEVNVTAQQMWGYSKEELFRIPIFYLTHPDDVAAERKLFNDMMTQGLDFYQLDKRFVRKDGSVMWGNVLVMLTRDNNGEPIHCIALFTDITDRVKFKEQVEFYENHDVLTHLPNRSMFYEELGELLQLSKQHETRFSVISIDLDGFQHINDTLGYGFGDRLLSITADRLQLCAKAVSSNKVTIARMGGDEFALLLSEEDGGAAPGELASRIIEMLEHIVMIDNQEVLVTASIGIASYPQDGETGEELLKHADLAMHAAKEYGKNSTRFYSPELGILSADRLMLEKELRKALELNELVLHYQPQFDISTKRIVGTEALIRWNHPTRGMVPPNDFIPLAEETGLIVPIGRWVIETACRQNIFWQQEGLEPMPVAVNLSSRQFHQPDLIETIRNILEETGLDPSLLVLEITESMTMNVEHTLDTLRGLQLLGLKISVDDFGTGYSSLYYLKKFPIDKLKIDRSFVKDISHSESDEAIVSTIISMARILNLDVIAEGVENEEQLSFLHNKQCITAQGFYFSRPLPAEMFREKFITKSA